MFCVMYGFDQTSLLQSPKPSVHWLLPTTRHMHFDADIKVISNSSLAAFSSPKHRYNCLSVSVKCCCLLPLMGTVIKHFVMLKFAVWLKLMLLFRSSTSHIKTYEKRVTCILPPPLNTLWVVYSKWAEHVNFLFVQYLPLKLPTTSCISSVTILLCLFTLHLYSLLLPSMLSQLYSLLMLLMFASHYYSHAGCVTGSCFLSAFSIAVYHSCSSEWYSFTGAVPCLIVCFFNGNAVAWNFRLRIIKDHLLSQTEDAHSKSMT